MHFRSPIIRQGGEISNKLLSWHSYASNDVKKYSYVTCRGEQSPSKFETYSRQVKSAFGWEADLNNLTARQVKSTFGTKRLIYCTGEQHKASLFPCLSSCLSSLCLQLSHHGSYLSFTQVFCPSTLTPLHHLSSRTMIALFSSACPPLPGHMECPC